MIRAALALDIGGSHVTAAVVDVERRELLPASRLRRQVDHESPAPALLASWSGAALEALERAGSPVVGRIGVAIPGPFDHEAGIGLYVHKFASLGGAKVGEGLRGAWRGTALAGVPFAFGNDGALFALGEWWAGAAREHDRVLGITLGTGLGAGFVAGGRPVYAGDGVPPDGGLWDAPYLGGIAEDRASGPAVARAYARATGRDETARTIAGLARAGDAHALAAFRELGEHLGAILEPQVRAFRPSCIVVGGNVARAWDLLEAPLATRLPADRVSLVPSSGLEASALLGAAALVADGSRDLRA